MRPSTLIAIMVLTHSSSANHTRLRAALRSTEPQMAGWSLQHPLPSFPPPRKLLLDFFFNFFHAAETLKFDTEDLAIYKKAFKKNVGAATTAIRQSCA